VESADGNSLVDHVRAYRPALRAALHDTGALLLRGFPVGGVDGFDATVREFSGDPLT
jgi:hypothetical protein